MFSPFAARKASARLVTQNLLVSAAAALEPERFVTDENVEDLATVISLACLYDRLLVVGSERLLRFKAPMFSYLRRAVVSPHEPNESTWKRAVARAERYAGAFLRSGAIEGANEIFSRIYTMSRRYGIDGESLEPDGPRDVDFGRRLLADIRTPDDLRSYMSRGHDWIVVAYVLRTFLYVSFSDGMGVPLAIDAARQPLLENFAEDSQQRVREAILTVVREGIRTDKALRAPLRRLASPFAAVVFNQSKTRDDILRNVQHLRDEQIELRRRLRPIEAKLDTTVGAERDEAQARVAAALEELAHRYSIKGTQDLTIQRVIAAFKPAASLAALKPMDSVEFSAKKLIAKDAESTLVELHRLNRKLPSTAQQDVDIKRLFDL